MKLAQNVIAHLTSNPCAESAKFDMFNSTADATLSHLKMEGYDEYDAIDKLFGVDILKEFVVDTPDGGTITKKFKGKIASWVDNGARGEGFKINWEDGETNILNVMQIVQCFDAEDA